MSVNIRVVHDPAPADNPADDLHIWSPAPVTSYFRVPVRISNALCDFFGLPHESKMTRSEITQRICKYATDRGLMDGQQILYDKAMQDLLGVKPEDKLYILNLQTYLKPHYRSESTTAFTTWWLARGAPLWVGVNVEHYSWDDLRNLYGAVLLKHPSVHFVLYTNMETSDAEAPCGCYGRDSVCEYHRFGEPEVAHCGCSTLHKIVCEYHK
jgi:hypothetical protein